MESVFHGLIESLFTFVIAIIYALRCRFTIIYADSQANIKHQKLNASVLGVRGNFPVKMRLKSVPNDATQNEDAENV